MVVSIRIRIAIVIRIHIRVRIRITIRIIIRISVSVRIISTRIRRHLWCQTGVLESGQKIIPVRR